MELPAMRSLFFVALDQDDMSVKRMQSFVTLQAGEFTSCVGCHENRARTARERQGPPAMALRRPASRIEPIEGVPAIFDFARDIQPILDKHCVACHDYEATDRGGPCSGGVILTGDYGFSFSHAFVHLTVRGQFSDGRNDHGNRPPRSIGTAASPLMDKISGGHHDVQLSGHEIDMVRYWIESGANFAGTYAAGKNSLAHDPRWPQLNCRGCHADLDWRLFRDGIYNLSRPERSLALLAPLSKERGGWGRCRDEAGRPVFTSTQDPLYRKLQACIAWASARRVDNNVPLDCYFHAMKVYGLLPKSFDPARDPFDVYDLDEDYWRSFWHRPLRVGAAAPF
jgi:hypothetical protein